jgi:hypothetical protein
VAAREPLAIAPCTVPVLPVVSAASPAKNNVVGPRHLAQEALWRHAERRSERSEGAQREVTRA